jgi:hypothetical protein
MMVMVDLGMGRRDDEKTSGPGRRSDREAAIVLCS